MNRLSSPQTPPSGALYDHHGDLAVDRTVRLSDCAISVRTISRFANGSRWVVVIAPEPAHTIRTELWDRELERRRPQFPADPAPQAMRREDATAILLDRRVFRPVPTVALADDARNNYAPVLHALSGLPWQYEFTIDFTPRLSAGATVFTLTLPQIEWVSRSARDREEQVIAVDFGPCVFEIGMSLFAASS